MLGKVTKYMNESTEHFLAFILEHQSYSTASHFFWGGDELEIEIEHSNSNF